MTAGSVTVRATGRGSTVTAVPAPRRVCLRMALSAAAEGGVSAASASALYPEHLGKSVKCAQHVEAPAALQGQSTLL